MTIGSTTSRLSTTGFTPRSRRPSRFSWAKTGDLQSHGPVVAAGHGACYIPPFTGDDYDSQTQVRSIPTVFPQDQSEDGEAQEPRHVPVAGRRRSTRARGPVLQTPVKDAPTASRKRVRSSV